MLIIKATFKYKCMQYITVDGQFQYKKKQISKDHNVIYIIASTLILLSNSCKSFFNLFSG